MNPTASVKQSGAAGGVSDRISIIAADRIAITIRKTTPTPRAPMSQFSNIEEVVSYLDSFAHSVNFTRKGVEGSLGADVAWTIIRGPDAGAQGGIIGRCADGVQPDGQPWPENSKEYAEEKSRLYGWGNDATNRRTNQMLSSVSLYGRTTIEPEVVTLRYGLDQTPSQSYAPTGHLSESDSKTTDTQKAQFAHSSGRGFYGLGNGDAENVHAVCAEAVNDLIREANGG